MGTTAGSTSLTPELRAVGLGKGRSSLTFARDKFAGDSPVEGTGFEPLVPAVRDGHENSIGLRGHSGWCVVELLSGPGNRKDQPIALASLSNAERGLPRIEIF